MKPEPQGIREVARTGRPDPGLRRTGVLRWFACFVLCAVAAGATGTVPVNGQADRASLDDVEAAYLYNFGKFVRWPESAGHGPLIICVAGKTPFGQTVARLVNDERIDDRPLQVRSLDRPEDAQSCSVLFVGTAARTRLDGYLAATDGKPVLTVSDSPDFVARGGIIQFVFEENHVRFSVNLNAASRNGLGLSSELLKVAISVTGGPGNGGPR